MREANKKTFTQIYMSPVVFFWVHGGMNRSAGTYKSREPQSGSRVICLFRAAIYSPMNPEKKTLIPYIYNVSNKDSFLNSPR